MVERIIEFCARNRFLVLLGVAFAALGAVWSIRQVKLDAIPDPSGTLLDRCLVTWTQEAGNLVHQTQSLPIVTFGKADGAVRTGSYLDFRNLSQRISPNPVTYQRYELSFQARAQSSSSPSAGSRARPFSVSA